MVEVEAHPFVARLGSVRRGGSNADGGDRVGISGSALALASAGCGAGTQLVPARGANRAPDQPSAAEANVGGVRLLVEGDAWPGRSATLARGVSAVLVIVENHSDRPVEIQRDDFALQGASGERFTTVAPSEVPAAGPQEPIPVPAPVFSGPRADRSDLAARRARTGPGR